jgi:ectoine hydroxylase-related dioxygenase (phytanoyl-CoA dioxygenase family)
MAASSEPQEQPAVLRKVDASTDAAKILRILNEDGCIVLERFLDESQVQAINKEIDVAIAKVNPGLKAGDERQKEFFGNQTKRMNNLVTRSDAFTNYVLDTDIFHNLCAEIFIPDSGTWWLNSAQVIEIGHGNPPQPLHRDMDNNRAAMKLGPAGAEVNVNLLVALTDFTEANGATRVIPKSNHDADFYNDPRDPAKTLPAQMKAGDVFLISGKVLHGGGRNTTHIGRRCIALSVQPAFVTPEEAFCFEVSLDKAKTLSKRVQKILGFRSHFPDDSMGIWMADVGDAGYLVDSAVALGLE